MTNKTNDPHIIVGRDRAEIDPADRPEDEGEGQGHPLPASGNARHGSIPESVERERGHGAQ